VLVSASASVGSVFIISQVAAVINVALHNILQFPPPVVSPLVRATLPSTGGAMPPAPRIIGGCHPLPMPGQCERRRENPSGVRSSACASLKSQPNDRASWRRVAAGTGAAVWLSTARFTQAIWYDRKPGKQEGRPSIDDHDCIACNDVATDLMFRCHSCYGTMLLPT
jgi:hypothetical protein